MEMASGEPRPLDVTIPVLPLAAAPSSLPPSCRNAATPLGPRGAFRDAAGAPSETPPRSAPLAHHSGGDGTPQAARHWPGPLACVCPMARETLWLCLHLPRLGLEHWLKSDRRGAALYPGPLARKDAYASSTLTPRLGA